MPHPDQNRSSPYLLRRQLYHPLLLPDYRRAGAEHPSASFEYFGMPGLQGNTSFEPHGKNEETFSNSTDYSTYDDALVKHDHKAAISFTVKSAAGNTVPAAKGVKKHTRFFGPSTGTCTLDGKPISADKVIVEHDPASPDETEMQKEPLGGRAAQVCADLHSYGNQRPGRDPSPVRRIQVTDWPGKANS